MRDKPRALDGEIPWVRIEDFEGQYIERSRSGRGVSRETVEAMNLKVFPVGAVLCSCSCNMGRTAIVSSPVISNQTFIGLVPRPSFTSHYLYYFLDAATPELNALGTGAIQQYLSQADFRALAVPVPPLPEQTKIADFLDYETAKIDALIEKQQQLIRLLEEQRQAVISHAVTKGLNPDAPMRDSGVEWLGEVPAHWGVTRLGWVCPYLSYGFTNPMPTADDGPFMLTAADIGFDGVQYGTARRTEVEAFQRLSAKCKPTRGDLLITKDGTLGRVTVLREDYEVCISQSVALVRPDTSKVDSDFLGLALSAAKYQNKMIFDAGGTTIKHIYITVLAKMNVALPGLDEQRAIARAALEENRRLVQAMQLSETAIDLLQERRAALISAAVTGKIDVRNWTPPESEPEEAVA